MIGQYELVFKAMLAASTQGQTITDSLPLCEAARKVSKIKVLSVAELLARGIRSIHEETSISELFI